MYSAPRNGGLWLRVALWNAAAVLVTAALVLLLLHQGVRAALLHELDFVLESEAKHLLKLHGENATENRALLTEWEKTRRLPGEFLQWTDASGESFGTEVVPEPMRPEPIQRFTTYSKAGFRIAEEREGPLAVRIGTPLSVMERDLAHIDRLSLSGALVVLVCSPLIGAWIAVRSLAPLTEMIATAQRLKPGMISERLPRTGTDDELDRLAGVVNGLLHRIDDYFRTNRDLLHDAAHQLRTPLAAIRSSMEVTLDDPASKSIERETLLHVIAETESLETLVNQMLLLAETEGNRPITIQGRVSLNEIVRQSVEIFEAAADALGVRLVASRIDRAEVLGRKQYLRQAILNLIDNAVKFTAVNETSDRRTVDVSLIVSAAESQVEFRVRDQGIGISDEHLPHVFERFYRADSVRTREGVAAGTGLGLAIVKAVAESHGGRVAVESKPGEGSLFTLTLPIAPEEHSSPR